MIAKDELEEKMGFTITDEKYQEICNLEYIPLDRIRTDLTFTKIHHLFVLGRAPTEIMYTQQKITHWWCICDCEEHNILSVRGNNLTSGNTKSCGCQNRASSKINLKKAQQKSKLDLTNQRFGKLVALYPTEERIDNSVAWVCQCDCGRQIVRGAKDLNAHRILSCGCLTESIGSFTIKRLLENSNIQYETEKVFRSCILPSSNVARFDFYLPEYNVLIEYDGEQHYKELDKNFFRDTLEQRQSNDRIKNEWCLKNNIPLYRIPYYDIYDIKTVKDIFKSEYLVTATV